LYEHAAEYITENLDKYSVSYQNDPKNPKALFVDAVQSPEDLKFDFPEGRGVPTALIPAMGDDCEFTGMKTMKKMIEKGTGGDVECIKGVSGLTTDLQTLSEITCHKLKRDNRF
jgi:hypothetical protein